MASAVQHYREAERLAQIVKDGEAGDTMLTVPELLSVALVEANLARVAVLASSMVRDGELSDAEGDEWAEVFGHPIERRTTSCEICEGTGLIAGDRAKGTCNEKCWNCDGTGQVRV